MITEVSGPVLFLFYAWPCAFDRLSAGKINRHDYETMQAIVEGRLVIGDIQLIALLCRSFEATRKFLESQKNGGKVWLYEKVAQFWHNHVGHDDYCSVRQVNVKSVKGKEVSIGLDFTVINFYGFRLIPGDRIYIHRRVIAEVESATAR